MKLGMQVGLGPGYIVLDGDPATLLQRGTAPHPNFSAHICCGQMAAWIKISLDSELGLGPGDFVLDGDPSPLPQKGAESPSPIFGPFLLWPNGWIHQDVNVGLSPGHFVLDGDPVPSPSRGGAPNFRPMFIVAKQLGGSRYHLA